MNNHTPRCVDCNTVVSAPHVKRCRDCYYRHKLCVAQERDPNYRQHSYCIDCGVELRNKKAKRCASCHHKTQSGEGNSNWRGSSVCPQCGGRKTHNKNVRLCQKCYDAQNTGLPKCVSCGGKLSRHELHKKGTGYCRKCFRGARHTRWSQHLTAEERYKTRSVEVYRLWRQTVYARDNYTCQRCGDTKGGNLVAHHLYSYSRYPKLRFEVNNGITLCRDCHTEFHQQYGVYGNTREQLAAFFEQSGVFLTLTGA